MSKQFEGLPDIRTIQPDRLIKHRVSEDGFHAEVLLPGLWYTDFDKKIGGKLTIWSIAKLFEAIRYVAFIEGFAWYDRLKDKNHSVFLVGVNYNLTKKINSLTAKEMWGVNFPTLSKLDIVHIGNSSFSFDANMYDHNSGEMLIGATFTFVYVDFYTRKPVRFPEWLMEQKQSRGLSQQPNRLATPSIIPKSAFKYETCALASDQDMNGHVNQSIFLKWCADAGAEAALKGHYSYFTDDIGKYPNKQIAIKYIGEGMQNDQFVVNTWQDENNDKVLHFAITKEGKIVFVSRFTYSNNYLKPKL